MSRAAVSMFVWSFYLFAVGAVLIVAPNFLLELFAVPGTREVWIRLVGMFLLFLGGLDLMAARLELRPVFLWAVGVRYAVPFFFGGFVWLAEAPPMLLLFAAVDAAAASWTALALRADGRRGAQAQAS